MLNDVELTQTHSNILILQPDPQIYDVSYKDVKNLEKKFKEGSSLRIRILGVRNLEGVAIGTVKVITSCHSFFLVMLFFKRNTGNTLTVYVLIYFPWIFNFLHSGILCFLALVTPLLASIGALGLLNL